MSNDNDYYNALIAEAERQQQLDFIELTEAMHLKAEEEMLIHRISEKLYGAPRFVIDSFIPEEMLSSCYAKIDAIASRYKSLILKQ